MINLAGVPECDAAICRELQAAGINIEEIEKKESEVPYLLIGKLGGWTFKRAWYYWMADAPIGEGIPEAAARRLNGEWFDEVRVFGYSGGARVKSWLSPRLTIDRYHIDTQEGLNAFASLVRKLAADGLCALSAVFAYTREQAKSDQTRFEQMAAEAAARGDHLRAGLFRVEAANSLKRVGMKKAHKPNLGPYSEANPAHCLDCGKPGEQWGDGEECIPRK